MTRLRLTPAEQSWLDAYREILNARFPAVVRDVLIYGSKARGTDTPDSDVDVLLIVGDEYQGLARDLARTAYDLALDWDVVPSMQIYTVSAWDRLHDLESVFREAVERDGVSVFVQSAVRSGRTAQSQEVVLNASAEEVRPSSCDPNFVNAMTVADDFMLRYKNVLRDLAK